MPADTAKVVGRRQLDYTSFEELLADAEQMSSGPVKALGNWSAGQIFKHLAIIYNGSIDGLPVTFPWHFRMMVKLFKTKIINGPMPPGFKMKPENAKFTEPDQYPPNKVWPISALQLLVCNENHIGQNTRCSAISPMKSGTRFTSNTRACI